MDNLFVINQIIEKALEYNLDVKFMFVDFKKVFDSVDHDYLWVALQNQGGIGKIIEIIKNIYKNTKAYIKTHKKGREFNAERGFRQGHPLSPNLFNCALEEVFKKLD